MSKTKSAPQGSGLKIALSILAGLLLLVCAGGIIFGLNWFGVFENSQAGLTMPPLDNKVPPEVAAARRQKDQAQLNSYGWVDKGASVVRIPISQAMILVADSGLPVGEPTATPTPLPTPTSTSTATPEPGTTVIPATPTTAPTPAPTVDLANVSFKNNVLPLFEQHCTKCHGGAEPKEGLRLTSYDEVMAGSMNGSVIEPGDVKNSYLIEMVTSGKMPKEGRKLTPDEIGIITAWVEAGAPNN